MSKGNGNFAVEMRATGKLKPYPANAKAHSEEAVAKLAGLIERFGFRVPIVVDTKGVIVKGHRTRRAAQRLGLKQVPVHVARGLSEQEARAWRIADNRVALDSGWDDELLRAELAGLQDGGFDLGLTGFSEEELSAILSPSPGLRPGADPDDVPALPKTTTTVSGDLIQLGSHRLLCADATESGAWERLLAGELAALIWTDPPYGVDYASKNEMLNAVAFGNRIQTPIENDALNGIDLEVLLRATFALAWAHTAAGGSWYVSGPEGPRQLPFCSVLEELKVWRHTIIWVKDGFVLGRSDYHYRHEPLWFGWKEGAAHVWNGGRSQDTVLEYPRPKRSDLHPTMKPVALVERCIKNSSRTNALIVDPFAGSGSTLIAAESSNRRAALMEIDPAYCDVIVQRWEQATGQQAARPARAA